MSSGVDQQDQCTQIKPAHPHTVSDRGRRAHNKAAVNSCKTTRTTTAQCITTTEHTSTVQSMMQCMMWVWHSTRLHSCCCGRTHSGRVVHSQGGRELRFLLQAVVLNEQFLECLPPLYHVEEVVGAFLVVGGLDAGINPWGSRDPHLLLLVVPPVSIVPSVGKGEGEG